MSKRLLKDDGNTCRVKRKVELRDEMESSSERRFPFKNPHFKVAGKQGKKSAWKSMAQIAAMEQLQAAPGAPTYLSIEAPPPMKPVKKYSDISGQLALYTDPSTGLHFSNTEEYKKVKRLPQDIVNGYLALRKANRIS